MVGLCFLCGSCSLANSLADDYRDELMTDDDDDQPEKPEEITTARAAELFVSRERLAFHAERRKDRLNAWHERNTRPRRYQRHATTAEDVEKWSMQRDSGMTLDKIASKAGCCTATVYCHLNKGKRNEANVKNAKTIS
jgi:hypothetical protein